MEDSFITLHRKFLKWGWYKKPNMVHLFIHFLLSATHTDSKFMGVNLKRGQVAIGLKSVSETTGISIQSIRTCIGRLKSTGEITYEPTHEFSIVTICKYNDYQNIKNKSTRKPTQGSTTNQHAINNIQQGNNKTKIAVRPVVFISPDQTETLIEKFGAAYEWALDELENYKQRSGTKYDSDFHALIGWVFKKAKKDGVLNNPPVKVQSKKKISTNPQDYFFES